MSAGGRRSAERDAQAAWLAYRDEYARSRPWCDSKRAARQMRKREFIAGYLAARTRVIPPGDGVEVAR